MLSSLAGRGILLIPDGDGLLAKPREKLTDADREAIRAHKAELLRLLTAAPDAKENPGAIENQGKSAPAAPPPRTITPDSRHPLIPPEVRAKIEAIEAEARRLGWPAELLWNAGFWDCPRGLAAVLDPKDEIAEVNPDCIAILKIKRDLLRFRRHAA